MKPSFNYNAQVQQPQQQQQPQLQHVHSNTPVRLPTKGFDRSKPLCAVIITVNSGSSYDHLYTEVVPEPPEEGVSISLWQLQFTHLSGLLSALLGDAKDEHYREIAADVARAEAPSVLLNFECCGGCTERGFAQGQEDVYRLVQYFVKHSHICSFGDYSTKALIGTWKEEVFTTIMFRCCCSNVFYFRFWVRILCGRWALSAPRFSSSSARARCWNVRWRSCRAWASCAAKRARAT
jgi:hypothetical protein